MIFPLKRKVAFNYIYFQLVHQHPLFTELSVLFYYIV